MHHWGEYSNHPTTLFPVMPLVIRAFQLLSSANIESHGSKDSGVHQKKKKKKSNLLVRPATTQSSSPSSAAKCLFSGAQSAPSSLQHRGHCRDRMFRQSSPSNSRRFSIWFHGKNATRRRRADEARHKTRLRRGRSVSNASACT